jgi:hypothetical protein
MISDVVQGCLEAELLREEEGQLVLNAGVAAAFPRRQFDPGLFRAALVDLLMQTALEEWKALLEDPQSRKRDVIELCQPLAWMLAQDVTRFQGDPAGFERELRAQTGDGRLGLTNPDRVRQFRFWVPYLGFGWMHSYSAEREETEREERFTYLVPDPTDYLSRRLPKLCGDPGTGLSIREFLEALARECPLFPGGVFHEDLASLRQVPELPPATVPSTVALALLRLQDRGELELTIRSDAEGMLLPDGTAAPRRCTHVRCASVRENRRS